MKQNHLIEKYAQFLPVTAETSRKSLGEGSTPLVRSSRLGSELGLKNLYFKLETLNPTGSFKDRGMFLAVAKAVESGSEAVICASTGNTSASASAYAALHGIRSFVVVPSGKIALGKLAQATVHGATIIQIQGSFDDALHIVREITERFPVALVNSVNPHRIDGQKTAAFEIVDELRTPPDLLCIPVGNAGNISAYWKGFSEYKSAGKSESLPKMWGFQAAGAAPIVLGQRVDAPETIATAIRIGNPASWTAALNAKDQSGGKIESVTDDEILSAYHRLATEEGIFCEPASAASVAGLIKQSQSGENFKELTAVCVITGHGLKDPDTALSIAADRVEVEADVRLVEEAMDLH
ncbi:MAG: threonine synthase [Chloroflexi bacterium]|nr:threonine synthase [Chloroflexota bacterium]